MTVKAGDARTKMRDPTRANDPEVRGKTAILIFMTTGVSIGGVDVGGGTRHILALARAWGLLGASVDIVTTEAPPRSLSEGTSLQMHLLRPASSRSNHPRLSFLLSTFIPFFRNQRTISEISRNLSRDCRNLVLIAGSPYISDVLSVLVHSRKAGSAKVAFLYHVIPPPWWFPRRRGGTVRSLLNWLQFQITLALVKIGNVTPSLFTPSELNRSGWNFHGTILDDQVWLEGGLSPKSSSGLRERRACFVGRVSPTKGVDDMIAAWQLVSRRVQASLVIAGKPVSNEYEREILAKVGKAGLSGNVKFLGVISDKEKEALLSSSAVFLFPSYEEGWAISVMEAASRGAVPIVYDLPAYSYLGDELTRVRVGDISGLASQTVRVLESRELQAELSRKLIARTALFRGEEIAARQIAFFRGLLQANGK